MTEGGSITTAPGRCCLPKKCCAVIRGDAGERQPLSSGDVVTMVQQQGERKEAPMAGIGTSHTPLAPGLGASCPQEIDQQSVVAEAWRTRRRTGMPTPPFREGWAFPTRSYEGGSR